MSSISHATAATGTTSYSATAAAPATPQNQEPTPSMIAAKLEIFGNGQKMPLSLSAKMITHLQELKNGKDGIEKCVEVIRGLTALLPHEQMKVKDCMATLAKKESLVNQIYEIDARIALIEACSQDDASHKELDALKTKRAVLIKEIDAVPPRDVCQTRLELADAAYTKTCNDATEGQTATKASAEHVAIMKKQMSTKNALRTIHEELRETHMSFIHSLIALRMEIEKSKQVPDQGSSSSAK